MTAPKPTGIHNSFPARLVLLIFAVYVVTTHILPNFIAGMTPSGRLEENGIMPFLEAAYNDEKALGADLHEMDRLSHKSKEASADYFLHTITARAMHVFFEAVPDAPDDAITAYFNVMRDRSKALERVPAEACPDLLNIDWNFPDTAATIETGEALKELNQYAHATYQAQADIISGARSHPEKMNVSPEVAMQMYHDNFVAYFKSIGKEALLENAAKGAATPEQVCRIFILASEAPFAAPEKDRTVIMKGTLLAAAQMDEAEN